MEWNQCLSNSQTILSKRKEECFDDVNAKCLLAFLLFVLLLHQNSFGFYKLFILPNYLRET